MERNLGKMGELEFERWCAQGGLIANGSEIDKTGWDFLVEFGLESEPSSSFLHQSPIEVKVQVKSTDDNKRKVSVKLSNLRVMATVLMPVFFVFIEFDGRSQAQRAFIVHVDEALSAKILKRIHEIEQSSEDNRLNKRTIDISYSERDRLEVLDGKTLKNCLLEFIGGDVSEYILKKKRNLEKAGYEEGCSEIELTFEGINEVVDMTIGLQKNLKVSNVQMFDKRFGIKSMSSIEFPRDMRVNFYPKPRAYGKIIFRKEKLSSGLSFDTKLYVSMYNEGMPRGSQKYRLESDFFDLVVTRSLMKVNIRLQSVEGRLDIREIIKYMKLYEYLTSTNGFLYVECIFEGLESWKMEVKGGGRSSPFTESLEALGCAQKLLSQFDVTDNVNMTFKEVELNKKQIISFEKIFNANLSSLSVDFPNIPDNAVIDEKIAHIMLIRVAIGKYRLGAFIVLTGNLEKEENQAYFFKVESLIIEKKIAVSADKLITETDLEGFTAEITQKYEREFTVTLESSLNRR